MNYNKIFNEMCDEFNIERLVMNERGNNECCIYYDDFDYDMIEYLYEKFDDNYDIDYTFEIDDDIEFCSIKVKYNMNKKFELLEKDFEDIQCITQIIGNEFRISFLNDFHTFNEILEIIWNRIDNEYIDILIEDYNLVIVKGSDKL